MGCDYALGKDVFQLRKLKFWSKISRSFVNSTVNVVVNNKVIELLSRNIGTIRLASAFLQARNANIHHYQFNKSFGI